MVVSQDPADLARNVDNMAELLQAHQIVHLDRLGLAHAVDVVAGQVDKHDVLCAVFLRREQLLSEPGVLCPSAGQLDRRSVRRTLEGLASTDSTRNSMVVHLSILNLAQRLGARTDNLYIPAVQVEHVRARVEPAQMSVDVERVQLRGPAESLAWHGLDDVPLLDVLLQVRHEALVPRFPHIALGLVAERDRSLRWQRHVLGLELPSRLVQTRDGLLVQRLDLGRGRSVRQVHVSDDLHRLERVVEDDERGSDHEECFGKAGNGVIEGRGGFRDGLEVRDGIVRDESDGAAWV